MTPKGTNHSIAGQDLLILNIDEFLRCCFVDHKLPELLTSLLVWLQQRPQALLLPAA
jgi:hypothetical protein